MTAPEVRRFARTNLIRNIMIKVTSVCFLLYMGWFCSGSVFAEETVVVSENPPSNEEFLRNSIGSLLERAFADFPGDKSGLLFLKAEEEHPAGWLLEDELISFLVSSDHQVALQSAAAGSNLQESNFLFYRIIDMSLTYPQIKRKGFLGTRILIRTAELNLSFRLEDMTTGKVLWSQKGKDEKSDQIKRSQVASVNNKTYPFLSPSLPDDPQSKLLEPALLVAVTGGLIYLFFANR
jgi:hypothetical protein